MGAPCINDTCSITSQIDPVTRRLEHKVNIAPSGGLKCVDGQGMAVEILGDPAAAAAVDTAFQSLGITPGGEMWSIPKHAKVIEIAGRTPVPIPENGTESNSPINIGGAVVNPFASAATVILIGRLMVGYTVDDPGTDDAALTTPFGISWIPFGAQLSARMKVDGVARTAVHFDIGGVHPRSAAAVHKRRWEYTTWVQTIGAGATLAITATALYQIGKGNEVQDFNVDTYTPPATAPAFADRGLMFEGQALILPMGLD